MNPDDNMNFQITCDVDVNGSLDVSEYSISNIDLSKYTISVSGDDTFNWLDDSVKYDNTFSVIPEKDNPSVYTSFEQREQHDKYPALKKAWEDYLNMYNLTQGEPPVVD